VISTFINQGIAKGGKVLNNCRYVTHEYKEDIIHVFTDLGVFRAKKLILSLGMGIKRL
jgi:sarcosine oxidase/N-methyl-L-tryptophan oxidase